MGSHSGNFAVNFDAEAISGIVVPLLKALEPVFVFVGFVMFTMGIYGIFIKDNKSAPDPAGEIIKNFFLLAAAVMVAFTPHWLISLIQGHK